MSTVRINQDAEWVKAEADRLTVLLEEEFEALKLRQVSRLDDFDQRKTQMLQDLQVHIDSLANADDLTPQWVDARDRLRHCRDLHFRNFQLLRRQLDAVQGALQAMMGDEQVLPGLYDKMGQVNRLGRARAYQAL